jgi:hypothetical protein
MPHQELHREFYRLAGLTNEKTMKIVDDMIDHANFGAGYRTFRQRIGHPLPPGSGWKNHNRARRNPLDAQLELMYLQEKPTEFRVAYFLHHGLDLYSDHKGKTDRSISECRTWAWSKMNSIFNKVMISRCRLTDEFREAEGFFKSSKSQYWLDRLLAKKKAVKKRRDSQGF